MVHYASVWYTRPYNIYQFPRALCITMLHQPKRSILYTYYSDRLPITPPCHMSKYLHPVSPVVIKKRVWPRSNFRAQKNDPNQRTKKRYGTLCITLLFSKNGSKNGTNFRYRKLPRGPVKNHFSEAPFSRPSGSLTQSGHSLPPNARQQTTGTLVQNRPSPPIAFDYYARANRHYAISKIIAGIYSNMVVARGCKLP